MNLAKYTPQENEFMAEDELIEIEPQFKGDKISFISGEFGPFRPAKPINVPLWLAIYLKQRQKCLVHPPLWMDVEFLSQVKKEERQTKDVFSEALPYYYFEMSQLVINECADELPNHKQVRSLIEDIFELRKEKVIRTLKKIDPDTPVAFLSQPGSAELNFYREAFTNGYTLTNRIKNQIDLMQS
uniref:DNA replication complex GINS protein PSF2 n=1 Tax=Strombidium inclinatum TaxID=197538 RepID=A0A7S3N086_9SPIT|mmetsp:Transcript_34729/g.53318  ORF Transcript_34729/g.53318 Transcript_34729/m.53318 type:complete len:185 (+) Transcript_34729:2-556(+)